MKEKDRDYPVFIKMNAYDGRKNGMRVREAVKMAKMLEEAGCDAIEVSCGFFGDRFMSSRGEFPVDAIFSSFAKYRDMPALKKSLLKFFSSLFIRKDKNLFGYNIDAAAEIKKAVSIPVIAVGGIHRVADIQNAVIDNNLDAVSMCRPLITEPDLVNKFSEGRSTEAKCKKCNNCLMFVSKYPVRCYYGKIPKTE